MFKDTRRCCKSCNLVLLSPFSLRLPSPCLGKSGCTGVCVSSRARPRVLSVEHYFLAALRSLKPNCVNHGLCVGDIKPPSTSPCLARWVMHTRNTHKCAQTHKSLKGTFIVAPSFTRLTIGDRLSAAVSLYRKDESLHLTPTSLQESDNMFPLLSLTRPMHIKGT